MQIYSVSRLLGLLLILSISVSLCYGDEKVLEVVGIGECSDCMENNIKSTHALLGLRVTIDCKVENGKLKRRGVGELNEEGKFMISSLPQEILKEECYAQLHSASNAPCADATAKISLMSVSDKKHTFEPTGKLKFSSAVCTSAFLWPFFKHHPLPKLKLPHKHWTKKPLFFGHLPPFPFKKPFSPPVVEPPSVPVYTPTPKPSVPVYNPPTKPPVVEPKPKPPVVEPKPKPPVPVYKPKPPVVHKPLVKPPPAPKCDPIPKPPVSKPPVYKPKPKPPLSKPMPKSPVYKPKPPVYKPKPEPPVFKTPPVPVYKPKPKPPFSKPKPESPIYKLKPKPEPPVSKPKPESPIYKPKPKPEPPVSKPKPESPIYKPTPKPEPPVFKTPPVPVYKPTPNVLPPPFYKKPFPPFYNKPCPPFALPNFPPKDYFHHLPTFPTFPPKDFHHHIFKDLPPMFSHP